MTQKQIDALFALLATAILRVGIARIPKAAPDRTVDPEEFMYMGSPQGIHQFKHRTSRNYVFVDGLGNMFVPATDKPFMQGEFPTCGATLA
jgi:hypothetical protein